MLDNRKHSAMEMKKVFRRSSPFEGWEERGHSLEKRRKGVDKWLLSLKGSEAAAVVAAEFAHSLSIHHSYHQQHHDHYRPCSTVSRLLPSVPVVFGYRTSRRICFVGSARIHLPERFRSLPELLGFLPRMFSRFTPSIIKPTPESFRFH